MVAEHPWKALSPEVAEVLRPELPALADEIVAELSRGVPDYARPLEGPFGQALRSGVEEALGGFTTLVENPRADRDAGREAYLNLGRGEMRAGRSLDALLAAYRLGARVAWRRLATAGERAGLAPRTLYALAEAIFAYIDELSADSIEGFAREQSAAAGEVERRRRRLVALLVQEPPADRVAVEAAAAEAGWQLPRSLAALAIDGEWSDRLGVRLGPDTLVAPAPGTGSSRPLACALVPDAHAPGRRAQLEQAVGDRRAALGPSVSWPEAALSFARAQATLGVASDREGVLVADDHRVAILLGLDRRLAADIADDALSPLAGETERSRERLSTTLEAWLRHRGRTEEVARALHVHPQTVRYRIGRIRELFGERLEDPDARFELELSLRSSACQRQGPV